MIKSKKLSKIKIIKHGFFNKTGGKSKKIYKSLNCGPGSKDNPSNVKKNLEIVKKKIKSAAKSIFLLHQIHSNKFVYINKKNRIKSKPKADAVITNQKNLPVGVLTADFVNGSIIGHTKIENLSKSEIPTLVINGGKDFVVDPCSFNRWKENLKPGDCYQQIVGGRHFFPFNEWNQTSKMIESFIDMIPNESTALACEKFQDLSIIKRNS